MSAKRFPMWIYWLALLVIAALAFTPSVAIIVAENIAHANGCVLDEGLSQPCMVDGKDVRDTLATLILLGWFWLLVLIIHRIAFGRAARTGP
jgi:uncharacterized membrane protein YhaH (DUF805 family)